MAIKNRVVKTYGNQVTAYYYPQKCKLLIPLQPGAVMLLFIILLASLVIFLSSLFNAFYWGTLIIIVPAFLFTKIPVESLCIFDLQEKTIELFRIRWVQSKNLHVRTFSFDEFSAKFEFDYKSDYGPYTTLLIINKNNHEEYRVYNRHGIEGISDLVRDFNNRYHEYYKILEFHE
jgi:hypothetical protein